MNLLTLIKNKFKLPYLVWPINYIGQLYIPKQYRKILEYEEGDSIKIILDEKRKRLILKKITNT